MRPEHPPAQHGAERRVEVYGTAQQPDCAIHVAVLAFEKPPRLHQLGVAAVAQDAFLEGVARLVDLVHAAVVQGREQERLTGAKLLAGNLIGTLRIIVRASFDGAVGVCVESFLAYTRRHHSGAR